MRSSPQKAASFIFFVCEQQPGSSSCARVMTVHVLTDALWTVVDSGGCFWRCCGSVTWVCYRKATRVWLLLFWHLDITNFFRLYSHLLHLRLVSEESRSYAAEESSVTIIGKEGTKKGRSIGHVGFYLWRCCCSFLNLSALCFQGNAFSVFWVIKLFMIILAY